MTAVVHQLNGNSDNSHSHSGLDGLDFSSGSDEELQFGYKNKTKKKRRPSAGSTHSNHSNMAHNDSFSTFVAALSDEELYERLKEKGVNIGPVVETTREVYRKMLLKILEGKGDGDSLPLVVDQEDEFSDNDVIQQEENKVTSKKEMQQKTQETVAENCEIFQAADEHHQLMNDLRRRVLDDTERAQLMSRVTQNRDTPTPRRSIHSMRNVSATYKTSSENVIGACANTAGNSGSAGVFTKRHGLQLAIFVALIVGIWILVNFLGQSNNIYEQIAQDAQTAKQE